MTKYLIGSNPNLDASWSTTSGGSNDTVKPTSSDDVILDSNSPGATLTANMTVKSFNASAYTNTLTHGAFSITSAGSVTLSAAMTYTSVATSSWIITATATLTTAGKLMPLITHNGGTVTQADDLNYMDNKFLTMTLSGTNWNMNGHNINGFSATSRILILSGTLGTGKTITLGGGTFSNANFRDITFSTPSDLDLSAITGLSGDCGGNTITGGGTTLTFTPAVSQTWSGTSGGNYSANAFTTRVPLPQDNVNMAKAYAAGQTITIDMLIPGKDFVFTGQTGNPALVYTGSIHCYGSYILTAGMSQSGIVNIQLCGRGSHILDTANVSMAGGIVISAFGGTYTSQSDISSGVALTHNNGTWDSNHKNVRAATFSTGNTNLRTILNADGTWTFTTSPTAWVLNATNLTFDPSNLKVVIGGTNVNFNTAGLTFGRLTNSPSTTGTFTISGGGHIKVLNIRPSVAYAVKITAGTTVAVDIWNVKGTSGKKITLSSTSVGSFASLSLPAGIHSMDYVDCQDIHEVGTGDLYAGAHSTNISGNLNIIFSAPPVTNSSVMGDEGMVS